MQAKRIIVALMAVLLFVQPVRAAETDVQPVQAAETSAYDFFLQARRATHEAGSFRFAGTQTTNTTMAVAGKTMQSTSMYQIAGYDLGAKETYIHFNTLLLNNFNASGSTALLLTTDAIYGKNSTNLWAEQDILKMLTQFAGMGVLDQFFLLELLNSDRLALYQDYLTLGPEQTINGVAHYTVQMRFSREAYAQLVDAWTADLAVLLGPVAHDMSDAELRLTQLFVWRTLSALDAEADFCFYTDKDTLRITKIDTALHTAGVGFAARTQAASVIRLYDFGQPIKRAVP